MFLPLFLVGFPLAHEQPAVDVVALAQPASSAQHSAASTATQSSDEQPALGVLPLVELNNFR